MKYLLLTISIFFSINIFAVQTPNGDYTLDKSHAHIGFKVSHLGFSHVYGRFNSFDGKVKFETNGDSSVEFHIDAHSIDTNNKRRDNHLRSDDFFDTEVFDQILFKSTKVEYTDGDPTKITGTLNLKGVEKEVSFNVKKIGAGLFRGKQKAGYAASAIINRNNFDLGGFAGVIGNDIEITINLEIEKVK